MYALISSDAFWGLMGVIVGLVGGEGLRWVRYRVRLCRLRRAMTHELQSIRGQIPQKLDIVKDMRESLKDGKILSGDSVPVIDASWRQHGAELYLHLSAIQHNCLHVIYESMRHADRHMSSFESDYRHAVVEKVVTDPRGAFIGRLGELEQRLKLVSTLIDEYLSGKPRDVFYLGVSSHERDTVSYD